MVNVRNKKCRTEACGKGPSFGVAGTKTAEYCAPHAPDGMVNVSSSKCRTESCGKKPSFGVASTKKGSTVPRTYRTGWSTSRTESAEPKVAERGRCLEWQVQKRRSTAQSTRPTEWSTSAAESAEPKAAFKRIGSRCTHRRVPRSRWVDAGDDVDVDVARCSLKSFSPLRCLLRTRGGNRLSTQVDSINS